MLAQITIQRFRPEIDARPHLQSYEIDVPDAATVLEALIAIKEQQDGSLSFRASCRSAICGSCAMRINGCARLACKTRVDDEISLFGSVTVEPLNRLAVIKDLIVDMEPFWDALRRVKPWLMPDPHERVPRRERLVEPDQRLKDIMRDSLCIFCGSCYADCNVTELEKKFIGPAALARGHRYVLDSRDGMADQRLRELSEPHGLWECARCFACTEVCPKDVDPREAIRAIGEMAYERGIRSDGGVRHAQAFLDSTRASGRLNEATLPYKTKGVSVLGMTPTAIRMALKGKIPIPIQRAVPDVDSIRRLFQLTGRK